MSKLKELIQQYCPDGVEYRPIWSLTAWDKKFNGIEDKSKQKKVIKYNYLLAADLKSYQVDGGTVKLLTTNVSNLYTTEELAEGLVSDGEVVAIPWGGNPIVQYYKGRFLTADNRIATSLDTTLLNNKFLYYCMLSKMKLIASFYRGSGIKHPEMSKVLDLEIPVPPLPVQEEIVRILDTFTQLQALLQTELQKRKQQYNYYRDHLLSFEGRTDVEWKKLGEVASYVKNRVNSRSITISSYVSVENLLQNRQGKTTASNVPEGSLIHYEPGDILIGNIRPYLKKIWLADIEGGTNGDVLTIRADKSFLTPNFLYQCLASDDFFQYDMNYAKGAKMPRGSKEDVLNYEIPIPSLAEQQKIVDILDRFDTLTNDLTAGIPAEIEKRKLQYEYYRDKLLTFPRRK